MSLNVCLHCNYWTVGKELTSFSILSEVSKWSVCLGSTSLKFWNVIFLEAISLILLGLMWNIVYNLFILTSPSITLLMPQLVWEEYYGNVGVCQDCLYVVLGYSRSVWHINCMGLFLEHDFHSCSHVLVRLAGCIEEKSVTVTRLSR